MNNSNNYPNNLISETVGTLVSETLVFTVPTQEQARSAIDALKMDGVGDDQIHVLSDGQDADVMHSHNATELASSSVKNSRLRGAFIGGVAGTAIGAVLFVLSPATLLMVPAMLILGVGVGGLGAQLIGVSEPDDAVAEAMDEVKKGRIAVLVEVARSRHEQIVEKIHAILPDADIKQEAITGGVSHS